MSRRAVPPGEPCPTRATLPTGGYKSLRVTTPGHTTKHLHHQDSPTFTAVVDGGSSSGLLKSDATWKIVPGAGERQLHRD